MKIDNISQYIDLITKIVRQNNSDKQIVYRGETEYFKTHCQPNLFRNNYIERKPFFEKNLFDEMAANKLTTSISYLEKAIDAQHGGFPSRLLDVTYNCLVALYFATTPHIIYPENSKDDVDGIVYIFCIDKIFCPSGENINLVYDSIVKREDEWLCDQSIFQKNHKLIDHIKTNKRIIAQQGAFILFQGDSISPIQKSDYKNITISKNKKKQIRKDLKMLFGIHTGSIYPEPTNLVDDIVKKSYMVDSSQFNINTELNLVLSNLDRDLQYYLSSVIRVSNSNDKVNKIQEISNIIREVEIVTYSYKNGFLQLVTTKSLQEQELFDRVITDYNNLIYEFDKSVAIYIKDVKVEFAVKELEIRGS